MSNFLFGIWADEPAFRPRTKLEGAGKAWGGFAAGLVGIPSGAKGVGAAGSFRAAAANTGKASRPVAILSKDRLRSLSVVRKFRSVTNLSNDYDAHHIVPVALFDDVRDQYGSSVLNLEELLFSSSNLMPWAKSTHRSNAEALNQELRAWMNNNRQATFRDFVKEAQASAIRRGAGVKQP